MSEYTNGKWQVSRHHHSENVSWISGVYGDIVIRDEQGRILANCTSDNCGEHKVGELEANAQLMSASPDLLEAIEYTLQRHQEGGFHEDRADFDDCKERLLSAKVKAIKKFNEHQDNQ